MRPLFFLGTLLFLFVRLSQSQGQPLQYQFSHIKTTKGLSHNQVNAILKDSRGFMWFGTMAGLNRYDGYTFKVFRHNLRDSSSLSDDYISSINEGPHGKLWIQTRNGFNVYDPDTEQFDRRPEIFLGKIGVKGLAAGIKKGRRGDFWILSSVGLYRYLPREKKTTYYYLKHSVGPGAAAVTDVAESKDGFLWISYSDGSVEQLNLSTLRIVFKMRAGSQASHSLFLDKQDNLWAYSTDSASGVYHVKSKTRSVERFHTGSTRFKLSTNIVNGISQDEKGLIWLGTDHGGLNLLNLRTNTVKYLLNKVDDEKSLSQNSINAIYRDNTGIMWVGTFKKGISYYHESIIKFSLHRRQASNLKSLSYDDVNRFVEDRKGNLWIGTNGGGLIYFDRGNNTYTQYRHQPGNRNSLSNDVIVALYMDHEDKLWIGTYYGGLDCFDGKVFTNYKHSDSDPESLADNRVWEILEDSQHNLWIGTLANGLDLFDRKLKKFRHFRYEQYRENQFNSVQSNYIPALVEDKAGNLWIGTAMGVDVRLKKNGKFKHFNSTNGLSNDNVISLLQDSRGLIWIGTREGLSIYGAGKEEFLNLRVSDGLPNNTILTILEDANKSIWLSTPSGLSNISVTRSSEGYSFSFKNYDEMDGLQGREFNENAALKMRTGELVFGGPGGFNIFNPKQIKTNKLAPAVVLTDFQLFNRSVIPGEKIDNTVVLEKSISATSKLVLNYDQDIFSIEFAALNFSNPEKNRYSYILEGFNNKWLTTDGTLRKATYTNLDPGTYTFRVRASNDNGVWNEEGVTLRIKILPPLWQTPTAYVLYVLSVLGMLFYIRHRGIMKLKNKFALEQERQEAQRMHELDMMKIKFFTNVSHEFRTPLSLILAPLDKILKETERPEEKRQFQLIQRNAKRLLHLVNQLLDFRKMEVQELKLQAKKGDIVQFIHESFQSFADLAEKKNIRFTLRSELNSFVTSFDQDKLERILFNLLSNAFKFTHEGGDIGLDLQLKPSPGGSSILQIKIKDSGIGIPLDKQAKIFDRFFQNDVPGSMVNQGSGIGLAITKEFVNLHNGTITVESEPENGSCFTIEIPVKAISVVKEDRHLVDDNAPDVHMDVVDKHPRFDHLQKRPTVLLIEDSEDFRFYLKDNLRQYYNIIEASNGKLGWNKALSSHPDLIVSDISMPEMSGMDLCQKIRGDKRTSHIPVILLTALSGEDQLLKGLETGANDYMTKPFNFEVLLSKIRNLLVQHESLRKTFQKQIEARPAEIEVQSADEKFIQQALQIVEKNISNPEFSVEELSREMCMSRVALYKKLLVITQKSPLEFIRSIRLKRAALLLEKSQLTVAEIAYEVGFNNPKYFAKYFKAEYGMLPSSYIKQQKNTPQKEEIPS
ncbi:hybrid sensor histidine kinase/response regulator transcription factor [Pedobacter sp. SYSU D00535]|uniref:hybrid sensor histidine kinase/response regulator transcription factor n=1 Tax=Pedobacter sp. SYSU D00535 TaxID=2810308 RepID=UPI001A96DAD6|nr:hybrid sensor histidine kinase/response regulator transcription factor [Pedobacter sp. SYSU D00535]